MTPDVVVDVGNTFTKTGVVRRGMIVCHDVHDDIASQWGYAEKLFSLVRPLKWIVAGVNPKRQEDFVAWALARGDAVTEVTSHLQLPIKVDVDHPEKVGLDRLLGAVAANSRRTPGRVALTVDVGTAVTVNLIDAGGTFTGGLILPGVRVMTRSLHQNTAKLPLIESDGRRFANHTFPGRSTEDAILAGVSYAIAGAVRLALEDAKVGDEYPELFLTGGGAESIADLLKDYRPRHMPTLVLDGLVVTAETLP